MGSEIRIRPATEEDLETVRSIFNYYVETSTCTFNLEPQTREECLASFRARTDKLPLVVAEIDGRVVGWAGLSQWRRPGTAYSRSVEGSSTSIKIIIAKGLERL